MFRKNPEIRGLKDIGIGGEKTMLLRRFRVGDNDCGSGCN